MNNYLETLYDAYGQQFTVSEVLFENKTEHQHLVIFNNPMFGRVMALDGIIQTTEKDEFIYHEMMTHVPIFSHGNAKRVLIVGGGDGGILREVLKHSNVEHVTQVEIDEQVIEMCKTYFPNHSDGAFDDERTHIVINDGLRFVQECDEKFDIIISDSTDPIGPGESLFTQDFYEACKNCLNDNGILVTQNGVAFMQLDEVTTTKQRLEPHYKHTTFYSAAVPTYIGGIMTFAWASQIHNVSNMDLELIAERYAASNIATRYYTPQIHMASFALPKYIVDILE